MRLLIGILLFNAGCFAGDTYNFDKSGSASECPCEVGKVYTCNCDGKGKIGMQLCFASSNESIMGQCTCVRAALTCK